MGIKQIIGIGIILLDLFVAIWLITLIGARNFGRFSLGYMFMLFMTALLLGVLGYINPNDWEKAYKDNIHNKNKHFKLFGLPTILIICVLLVYKMSRPYLFGMLAGFLIIIYMVKYCRELLYTIEQLKEFFDEMLKKRFKWLDK